MDPQLVSAVPGNAWEMPEGGTYMTRVPEIDVVLTAAL